MAYRNKMLLAMAAAIGLIAAAPAAQADADRWVQNRDGQWVRVDDDRDDGEVWDRADEGDWDRSDKKRSGDDSVWNQGNDGYGTDTYGRGDKDLREMKLQFQQMDRNRDGIVTRAEWRGREADFRNQDRNRDGKLTVTEMQYGTSDTRRVGNNSNQRQFESLDRNDDGTVSRTEWRHARGENYEFDRLDTNRDGRIQRRELRDLRTIRDDRY